MGILVLFSIVGAIVCAILAEKKKRGVGRWIVAGFCFGLFAVLVLLVLGEPEKKRFRVQRPKGYGGTERIPAFESAPESASLEEIESEMHDKNAQ